MHEPRAFDTHLQTTPSATPAAPAFLGPKWAVGIWQWAGRHPRAGLFLAVAQLGLTVLASAGWYRAEQLLRQSQEAERRLQTAAAEQRQLDRWQELEQRLRELQDAERWTPARALAQQAQRQAGSDERRQEAGQWLAEMELAERLDALRQRADTPDDTRPAPDRAEVDRGYAAVLAPFAIREGFREEVAARVRASGAGRAVLRALDDWAARTEDDALAERLLQVCRLLDPGPWADRLRDPALRRDPARFALLVREAPPNEVNPELACAVAFRLHDPKERVTWLRRAQAVYPEDFWLALAASRALLEQKAYDEAVVLATMALASRPDSPWACTTRGLAWLGRQQFDKARVDFERAFRLDPTDAPACRIRGNAWLEVGDVDRALAELDRAVERDPHHAGAYNARGLARYAKREYARAVADYDQAIRLDPGLSSAYNNRGNARYEMKDHARAIADFTEAVRLAPEDAAAATNLAWTLASCPDAPLRDGRRAVELARHACERTQDRNALSLEALAMAHAEAGDFSEAVRIQKKALLLGPGYLGQGAARLALYETGKPYRDNP